MEKKIAIVGRTGCGKSTLLYSLFNMIYNDTNSSIFINNINLNTIHPKTLRKRMGIIPQDSWISSGTIRSNLNLG